MTTTIDTIEDLIRILDDNPEWLEAVRSRLLTRELLDMPKTLALFMETTNKRFDEVDKRFGGVDERFDEVDKRFDGVDERFDGVDKRFDRVDERFDGLEGRVDRVEARLDRVDSRLGVLMGTHARNQALREIPIAVVELGMGECKRVLELAEVVALTIGVDTTGISSGDLASFRRADAIADVVDRHGESCYVAVEISYTADDRDTDRALRNADYVTRFTGRRAHAAIMAVQIDDRISDVVNSGSVPWHRLDPQVLEAE